MSADSRDDSCTDKARPADSGRARSASQQRVGILRNPNRAPQPPPRRASLMGKWPSLRSSRRAQPEVLATAALGAADERLRDGGHKGGHRRKPVPVPGAHAPPSKATPQVAAPDTGTPPAARAAGQQEAVHGIQPTGETAGNAGPKVDIGRLMAEVAGMDEGKPRRSRFGEAMRPVDTGQVPEASAAPAPRRQITTVTTTGTADMGAAASGRQPAEHEPSFPFAPLARCGHTGQTPPAPPYDAADTPAGQGRERRAMPWIVAGIAVLAMIVSMGG